MFYEELLIGFDAREMWLSYDDRWSQERRDGFLLRHDLIKPLSVDRLVWPSLFLPNFVFIGGTDWGKLPEAKLAVPIEQHTMGFWRELGAMEEILGHRWTGIDKSYWTIAITELMTTQDKQELQSQSPFTLSEIQNNWSFLGYDIGYDSVLWSALSGNRFESDELQPLQERWMPYLNEYHLFTDQEQAGQFADWADSRDRGHAPHSINGLYRTQILDKS
jgi:hypothetical protein